MNNMSLGSRDRVFVTCKTTIHDLSVLGTSGYGEVIVMSHKSIFPDWSEDMISGHVQSMLTVMDTRNYRPDEDWLALTGDPVLMACCATYAFNISKERVRFLKYDSRSRAFYKVEVETKVIGDGDGEAYSDFHTRILGKQGGGRVKG